MKRGTIKAFREYLNQQFPPYVHGQDRRHRNNQFQQRIRLYGDYLYNQDRGMFDALLSEAMRGATINGKPRYPGFDYTE